MTSLFDGSTTEEPKDYLESLIGEGGKFYNPDRDVAIKNVAKGKYESDLYVNVLERQMDELRKDYLKEKEDNTLRAELEKFRDQAKQIPQQSQSTPQPAESKPLNPDEIKSLVSEAVISLEDKKRRDANFNLVKDKLTERFGSNYQPLLEQQIKTLDLTIDEANELARNRPQVFIKTFGLDSTPKQETFNSPPRTSMNTTQFKPEVEKRTWSYYQKMKMEDPKRYVSPSTNVQMHKDMMELGDTFMDGDFNKDNKELTRELGFRTQPPSAISGYNPFASQRR